MDNETKRMLFDVSVWTISLLVTVILLAQAAWADSNAFSKTHPKWKAECGSCHTAYPPQLLPTSTWRRIMATLDRHFGTDATLDAAAVAEIQTFLEQNAGTGKRVRGMQTLRITESAWFRREHREMPGATWKLPGVKTASNGAACHTTADQGDFRERNIRVPH